MEEERLTDGPTAQASTRRRARARSTQQAIHPAERPIDDSDEDAGDSPSVNVSDMTDTEFLSMLNTTLIQSVLPDLPRMQGYHVCWASTTSSHDTIPRRERLGYELVRPEMLSGWDKRNIVTGDRGPVVMVNEMIAMRIPKRRYDLMMRFFHHDQPQEQDSAIRSAIEQHREQAEEYGSKLLEGDGMAAFGQKAPKPKFVDE